MSDESLNVAQPGTARPLTQAELAKLAGVSQMTIHRAVSGGTGVSERTRKRVLELAQQRGYRVDTAARTMRTGQTGQIGVLLLDTPSELYVHSALFELIWGINQQCDAADLVTSLMRVSDVARTDVREARIFREHLIDGVIVVNMLSDRVMERVRRLVPRCVWLDTNMNEPTGCIRRDEYAAGRLAAETLVKAGHRKVVSLYRYGDALLDGTTLVAHFSGEARHRGARDVFENAGVKHVKIEVDNIAHSPLTGLAEMLRDGAGLLLFDVYEARRVTAVSSTFGIEWGKDCSVVCVDDAADLQWWWPELTCVRFDRIEMGRMAVRMMEQMLQPEPKRVPSEVIPAALVEGSTVRKTTRRKS